MLYRFNVALGLFLALVFALLGLTRVDNSRPNYEVKLGDDMTYSPAYASFEVNYNFSNGRTLQSPVPGTIARSTQHFHFEATPQDALRAGEQLTNPFDLSSEEGIASVNHGAIAFKTFCIACHGTDGAGNGPVARRGFPPPPSLLAGKSREMKDGQLFHVLTYGQNSMPQFAAHLTPQRRWDVINHIRRLQRVEGRESRVESEQEAITTPNSNPIIQPDSVVPLEIDAESKP